jgi:RNA polymerase sigma-70 factor (ECF subfamily)
MPGSAPDPAEADREFLLRMAKRHCRGQDLGGIYAPSDLVHEALLRAIEAERAGNGPTRARRPTWLVGILKNVIRDKLKFFGRKRRNRAAIRPLPDESNHPALAAPLTSPSRRAARNELGVRFATAIARLPENQRRAAVQHYVEDQSLSQIAANLGQAKSTISNWIARAAKQLSGDLGPLGEDSRAEPRR